VTEAVVSPRDEVWTEIRPGSQRLSLHELWSYRELVGFLAWRELQIRYKQAVFGIAWAVVQPLAAAAVFTVIFGRLAGLPSGELPYPLFAFVGVMVWTYFSGAVNRATEILVSNAALVSKVYFPRLVAPAAAVLPGLVDFAVSAVVLAGLLLWYRAEPTWALLAAPLLLVALVVTALGVGLWLGALNVMYRDVGPATSLALQLWLFLTPVAYASASVPAQWRALLWLNPVAGLVEMFRWSLAGAAWPGNGALLSLGVSAVVLAGGVAFFQRRQRAFADVI
jgi:ABC-type polysaccharide/polyol phosphate export permease